jgi:N-acetylglutamate synthase-like GNAT family acetyltransferase
VGAGFTGGARRALLRLVSVPELQARRATVDDLPALRTFWEAAGAPVAQWEKRITEFQILQRDGAIVGSLGLRLAGLHSCVYGEALREPDDVLRAALWERVSSIARNHGLVRLWTLQPAEFWAGAGFVPADSEVLQKLPPVFQSEGATWRTLKLKDELTTPPVDEFAIFKEAARAESEKVMRQAKILKVIALVVALAVGLLIVFAVLVWFQHGSR